MRLVRFTRMLHGVESADPEAVHRMRVASRRMRELLPVLELDAAVARKLGRRLRKVTRALGPLREADVLRQLVDELRQEGRSQKQAWRRVSEQAKTVGALAREGFSGKAAAAELRRVGRKLERIAKDKDIDRAEETRRPTRGWRWAIDARVARRAQTLRSAITNAGGVYLQERLHEVRIALKKLRYAAELSADADGLRSTPDLRLLKRAQDLLGRIRDLQVLTDHIRQVQASLTPPDATAWQQLDALVTALEQDCRRLHARYLRESGRLLGLCDRLSGRAAAAIRRAG